MGLFERLSAPFEIDRQVRAELANSLAYVFERTADYLHMDSGLQAAIAEELRAHRQDPGIFARYFDLVSALGANDFVAADRLLREIARLAPETPRLSIASCDEETLGADFERFSRLVFAEFAVANPMSGPSPQQFEIARDNLEKALDVIKLVDPRVTSEIEGLLSRIYVAVGSKDGGARRFGGATSFMVWGATFMNADHYTTADMAAEFLVHEVTHALLSGLAATEPLVHNPPDAGYVSPLRQDFRPMDGIFHATIVCGRLSCFYRGWADGPFSATSEVEKRNRAAIEFARRFVDGRTVIDAKGDLSGQAQAILDECDAAIAVDA